MTLAKLIIRNFQKHEKLTVEFDPRITVITGPSAAGKSAVLRALRWVLTNRPGGMGFLRHGRSRVSVDLAVDGRSVRRVKGTGRNLYKLDGEPYKSFGSEVPAAIRDLLNVGEDNYQSQLAAPFWFLLSPGEVAKRLNAIVNLDLIDRTQANLSAEQRKARAAVEVSEDRLRASRKQRDALAWVRDADVLLCTVEKQYNKVNAIAEKRSRITRLLADGGKLDWTAKNAAGAILATGKAVAAGDRAIGLQTRIKRLSELLYSIEREENRAWQLTETIRKNDAEINKRMRGACPLCGSTQKARQMS